MSPIKAQRSWYSPSINKLRAFMNTAIQFLRMRNSKRSKVSLSLKCRVNSTLHSPHHSRSSIPHRNSFTNNPINTHSHHTILHQWRSGNRTCTSCRRSNSHWRSRLSLDHSPRAPYSLGNSTLSATVRQMISRPRRSTSATPLPRVA